MGWHAGILIGSNVDVDVDVVVVVVVVVVVSLGCCHVQNPMNIHTFHGFEKASPRIDGFRTIPY